ncbi:MlaD family protein [Wolbachia endosymbiont of Litomosoides brasiliensis]|uniref:MlaD family protein n=1 Tax=Wolbachia endosymbiont of Litomosoides brasiliensis TaxID=1812117 RepID=UPI0034E2A818
MTARLFVLIFTILLAFFVINELSSIKKATRVAIKYTAFLSNANGIGVSDSVKIFGVDIGSITGVSLDKAAYVKRVGMCISEDMELLIDSSALITSNEVVGSKFFNISPGSGIKLISNGDKIEYT